MNLPVGVSTSLARILRPQAAYRWILPYIAAITPYYVESTLRGALAGNHVQQWELFDLMLDTWPELSACAQELTDGVMRKKLIYEPFHEEDEKPSPEAVDRMQLVSTALRAMQPEAAADENDLRGTIKDIIDGWFRGVTALEVDWHVSESRIKNQASSIVAPRATFWVHPVCFAFNTDGVLGLRAGAAPAIGAPGVFPFITPPTPNSGVTDFPPNKFLIGIHKQKSGSALGGAMLRPLCWWWLASNFSADWLLNLAQLFGIPFRWATYDPNAPQALIDSICTMLQNMGSAGYAAFPDGTKLEMKESGGGRQAEYSPQGTLLDRADRYARMVILGQTMSGQSMRGPGKGGQAFGTVEKDVKDDRIDAAGNYACDVINRQLITSILMLNYGDATEPPHVRLLEEEEGGLQDAQRDQVLTTIGLPIGMDFARKKYGIPEPAEEEETLEPVATGLRPVDKQNGPQGRGYNNNENTSNLQSRLEKISQIDDDEVFAKELQKFAGEIAATDAAGHWITFKGRHVFITFSDKEDTRRFVPIQDAESPNKPHHILDMHNGNLVQNERNKPVNFHHHDDEASEMATHLSTVHTERMNLRKSAKSAEKKS